MIAKAKKYWNISQANRPDTIRYAYDFVCHNCAANLERAKIAVFEWFEEKGYFSNPPSTYKKYLGIDSVAFWQLPGNKSAGLKKLQERVDAEYKYRVANGLPTDKAISADGKSDYTAALNEGTSDTGNSGDKDGNGLVTFSDSVAGQRVQWILIAVIAALVLFMMIKR